VGTTERQSSTGFGWAVHTPPETVDNDAGQHSPEQNGEKKRKKKKRNIFILSK
jgi:hypothetical protein